MKKFILRFNEIYNEATNYERMEINVFLIGILFIPLGFAVANYFYFPFMKMVDAIIGFVIIIITIFVLSSLFISGFLTVLERFRED